MKIRCLLIVVLTAGCLPAMTQVGIGTTQPDNSAMLDVSSVNKGLLIPRMTKAQRDGISPAATGLLIYQTDQTPGFYYYNGSAWTALGGSGSPSPSLYFGKRYQGGVIIFLDSTGQHGLICSAADIGSGNPPAASWSNVTNQEIGPDAQSLWNGQGNTTAIVTQIGCTGGAAKLCNDYENPNYGTGVYSDWFLPSIDQFSLIFHARYQINMTLELDGNSATTPVSQNGYWTSTEYDAYDAFYYDLDYYMVYNAGKSSSFAVRAVRTF